MCLLVQTRADAQGDVYNITINSCRKNCQTATEASAAVDVCGLFCNGTNVSLP